MKQTTWKRQAWMIGGGIVVVMLAAAVFTLGSLNIRVPSQQGNDVVILYAISTFIFALLLVFSLILARSLLRLWAERRSGQMGSRFKVKMVLGAMGVSLLPVVFLFFFSYALVNRTLNMWFPRPLEIANEQSQKLLYDMGKVSVNYLSSIAAKAAADGTPNQPFLGLTWSVDAEWVADSRGAITSGVEFQDRSKVGAASALTELPSISPKKIRTLRNGAEVWEAERHLYLSGSAPLKDGGTLYIARRLPDDYL
jgi:nitrogen fixation/metabolism regulation signal transduction histidine kinase